MKVTPQLMSRTGFLGRPAIGRARKPVLRHLSPAAPSGSWFRFLFFHFFANLPPVGGEMILQGNLDLSGKSSSVRFRQEPKLFHHVFRQAKADRLMPVAIRGFF